MNSERDVSALVDNLPGMAFRCANDRQWTMLFVSAGAKSLTGYTAADLVNNANVAYADLIHPDDREHVWLEVQRALVENRPFNLEYRIRDVTGAERWLWQRGVHVRNAEGRLECVEGFISDISVRKEAENALRESQARYQHLFEMESDAIVLVANETGRILEVNQAACELYGYSRAEWLKMCHTDVSAEPSQTREAALKGQPLVPLRWHRKHDGTIFPVEITGSHFEWRGLGVHIAAIRDITERVRVGQSLAEERNRLRTLVDNLPDMIFIKDMEGRVISCNAAAIKFKGLDESEQAGKTVFDLNRADLARGYAADDMRVLHEGVTIQNREERIRDHAGVMHWHITTKAPLRDQEGKIVGLVAICRNIDERKQAEVALRESEERFRMLFEHSIDGVLLTAPEGDILSANPAACRMLRRTEAEICHLGRNGLMDITDPRLAAALEKRERTGQIHGEVILIRSDGSRFDAEISSVMFTTPEGMRTSTVIRDITERKQAESRLADQLRELQRWHNATLGRETRILELKQQVNDLLSKAGQPPRYPSALPQPAELEGLDPAPEPLP
jgi:PAS domain S-box-containing protein